ncbi:hypothetical protein BDEG_24645 [Batrachochytrium dendrobatidis JEL423]|uniref:Calcineurin-like phosphoesterase domain-containing protein n=1 Tax=Batrachochytrium dendrobatidis (strain JEL423) TaxID=403673 RepID=A0A177WMT8_BATDL|nr:hypothetical protein BDEG_24645 [Batrachochytrium dendrobatidis JEL423]
MWAATAFIRSIYLRFIRVVRQCISQHQLAIIMLVNVLMCELISIRVYIYSCYWPRLVDYNNPLSYKHYGTEALRETAEVHIAVIADPQIIDAYTYDQQPGLMLYLTEIISDNYMKRNYRLIQQVLRPHHVIFPGDMTDGGREWKDDRYKRELNRLQLIFAKLDSKLTTMGVPGNHDIGFGDTDTVSLSSKRDTPAKLEAVKFMEEFEMLSSTNRNMRNILVTHVPLYRPANADCGPRRTTPPIRNMYGFQFQNLVQPKLTREILSKFKPELILSGDDHDDCVYTHIYQNVTSVEHSIGTFSFLQGNPYPSFGVLSLRSAGAPPYHHDTPSLALHICSLPPQKYIYIWYIALGFIAIIWTCLQALCTISRTQSYSSLDEQVVLPKFKVSRIMRRAGTSRGCIAKRTYKFISICMCLFRRRFWELWAYRMCTVFLPCTLLFFLIIMLDAQPSFKNLG